MPGASSATMDGKAPLLAASVLFAVGAVGLLLTGAERGEWGPFQAHQAPPAVVVSNAGTRFVDPPALEELLTLPATTVAPEQPHLFVAAPVVTESPPPPEPTATPVPSLRVFGISSDSGVSAAEVSPTPRPIMLGGIAADDGEATEEPEGTETPAPSE